LISLNDALGGEMASEVIDGEMTPERTTMCCCGCGLLMFGDDTRAGSRVEDGEARGSTMNAKDVTSTHVSIAPDASMIEALRLMLRRRIVRWIAGEVAARPKSDEMIRTPEPADAARSASG
jgi:CBS domain-containing protein